MKCKIFNKKGELIAEETTNISPKVALEFEEGTRFYDPVGGKVLTAKEIHFNTYINRDTLIKAEDGFHGYLGGGHSNDAIMESYRGYEIVSTTYSSTHYYVSSKTKPTGVYHPTYEEAVDYLQITAYQDLRSIYEEKET